MNQKALEYISSNLKSDDRSRAADTRIFYRWDENMITSKQAYNYFFQLNGLDRSLVSVDEFVEFMESLGYGNGVELTSGPSIDRDIRDGLRYIRRKLKRSTASSDVKVFTDWSRKNINVEEALERVTKNNKMDKKMIPIESFVMFMNGVGYYA